VVPVVADVRAVWSDGGGDLSPLHQAGVDGLVDLARAVADDGRPTRSVHWLRQVHGSEVHLVTSETSPGALGWVREGDALVATSPTACLATLTADCPSIALGSPEGVFAAVHAGWRGLAAGVVQVTVDRMRACGATEVVGALGPCIHAECYQFSAEDLDTLCGLFGDEVRAETSWGRPALDLVAAVRVALDASGVRQVAGVDVCTACSGRYFSHRARADRGRQALLVWSIAESRP
jgi:hypothetical protein